MRPVLVAIVTHAGQSRQRQEHAVQDFDVQHIPMRNMSSAHDGRE